MRQFYFLEVSALFPRSNETVLFDVKLHYIRTNPQARRNNQIQRKRALIAPGSLRADTSKMLQNEQIFASCRPIDRARFPVSWRNANWWSQATGRHPLGEWRSIELPVRSAIVIALDVLHACKTKSRKRAEQAKYLAGLCCENCIHYNAESSGTENESRETASACLHALRKGSVAPAQVCACSAPASVCT